MLVIVAIVCLDTFSFFVEPKDIVKLTILIGLREIDLIFDAREDVSVIALSRGLDHVDINLRLCLRPVLDTVPILQYQTCGAVRFFTGTWP